MANANTPMGLTPIRHMNGTPWNGGCTVYCIPNTEDTNAYAIGDPVVLAGSADAKGVPTVILATPGSSITGVIVGMGGMKYGAAHVDPDNLTTVIPATKTKDYYVLVCDDPTVVFKVQEIGTGTPLAAAQVGLNANLVAGANNGYVSGWLLTNSTEATTATLDVKLLRLSQEMNNDFGAYAKWEVMINNHSFRAGSDGV